MLSLFLTVFILCWSPYFIFNLMGVYHLIPINSSTMGLHSLVQSLAPLNSAANPIIYGVFSTRICRQLRWVVLCCVLQYLIEVTFTSASSMIYLFGIDVETGSLFWCFFPFYFIQRNNALHSIHKLITTREDCRKSVSNCHLKFCIGSQLINVFLLVSF